MKIKYHTHKNSGRVQFIIGMRKYETRGKMRFLYPILHHPERYDFIRKIRTSTFDQRYISGEFMVEDVFADALREYLQSKGGKEKILQILAV